MEGNYWTTRRLGRRGALRGAALGLAGLAGAALIGCGGGKEKAADTAATGTATTGTPRPAEGQPRRGGILLEIGNPPHLDVSKENTDNTTKTGGAVVSRLVRFDPAKMPDRVITGDLAEKWEIADGGKSVAFTLRKGVTWHDGKPFTSADVAATIERAKKVHPFRDLLTAITTVETPDDVTAVFKLSKVTNYLLDVLQAPVSAIVPKHIITVDDKVLENKPIGTGPFQLESWDKGVSVALKRNENYFLKAQGLPRLDGLRFATLADSSAQTNGLRTGGIHLAVQASSISKEDVKLIQAAVPGIQLFQITSTSLSPIWMNTTKAPFNDDRVRRAVSLVVDQHQYANLVSGHNVPGGYATGSGLSDEQRKKLIPGYRGITPADVAEAKKLVGAAGITAGATVDYLIPTGTATAFDYQGVLQSQLNPTGMKLKVNQLTYPAETIPAQRQLRFQMSQAPWVFAVIHPSNSFQVNVTGDTDNRTGYSNKEYDALYQKLVSTLDAREIASLAEQMETILAKDVPWVLAWQYAYVNLVRPEVGGWPGPRYLREYMDHLNTWLRA